MSNYISKIPRTLLSTAFATIALSVVLVVSAPSGIAQAVETLLSGTFAGENDHTTTGKITIEKDGDRTIVVLHDDFSLDGAPNPTLGFSKAGEFDVKTEFTKLKSLKGEQRYEVPAGIIVNAYDAFTVWCSKFSISLGSAKLK